MQKFLLLITTGVIFILLIIAFLHPSTELSLDLGEHIRFGEIIVQHHQFPTTNLFSYTYPQAPFIHHEFLPDAVFYILFHLYGIPALILFTTAVVAISFGLLFFYAYKRVSPVVLFAASFLFLRILFERTYVRPEIFSYLFVSVFAVILLTFRRRFTKWIYLLIPLEWLWVNSHIYFIFGIFLMTITLGEFILTKQFVKKAHDLRILIFVFFASCLVCLLNPNGLAGAIYPFTVFHNYGFPVQENNSIFTVEQQNPGVIIYSILFFKITSILLIIFLLLSAKTVGFFNWIVSLSFIILAATAIRNFPLFVFGAFVPFVVSGDQTVKKYLFPRFKKNFPAIMLGLQILMLGIFLWHIGLVNNIQPVGLGSIDAANKGITFFKENHIPGPIFNNYGIGSYLVFKLYPNERVFVDGRPEAYPANFFAQTYFPMQTDPSIFKKVSKEYQFNSVIFDYLSEQTKASQQFLHDIVNNPEWKLIYLDDTIVILVKNTPQNKITINRFGVSEQTFNLEKIETNESSLENLLYFFQIADWKTKIEDGYQMLLQINPNNCAALAHEITMLAAKNDPGVHVIQYHWIAFCQK